MLDHSPLYFFVVSYLFFVGRKKQKDLLMYKNFKRSLVTFIVTVTLLT